MAGRKGQPPDPGMTPRSGRHALLRRWAIPGGATSPFCTTCPLKQSQQVQDTEGDGASLREDTGESIPPPARVLDYRPSTKPPARLPVERLLQ